MATVIGESCLIKGNLEGDEDLTVFGRIEGSMNLNRTLIIEPSGIVKADVQVRNAIVNGVVVGNIIASDSIELTEEARVVGDLTAPRVIIVDGASFRGQVDMGDLDMKRPDLPERTMSRTQLAGGGGGDAEERAPARRATPTPTRRPTPARTPTPARAPTAKKKAPSAPPKPPRSEGKTKVKVKKKRR